MYVMQSYSRLLSETPISKGPPYPPGAWITFNGPLASLAESVEAFKRVMAPTLGDSRVRNRDEYRIRQVSSKKRCYDIDGNAILSTAKPQSLLKAA